MQTLERALETLATRGTPSGADVLIERLEMALDPSVVSTTLASRNRISQEHVVWHRGVTIALATSLVVLAVAAVGALMLGLVRSPSPDVATPVVTTLASPDQPPSPERLFDGMAVRGGGGQVTGVFQDGQFVPLVEGECCIRGAVSDLGGGVVFQPDDSTVLWERGAAGASGRTPVTIVDVGATQRVSLEGVAAIGGGPIAVVIRFEATPDGDRATVETIGLANGDQSNVFVAGEGDIVVDRVSYGGDTYLVSLNESDGSWFEFRDESGAVVAVPSNPRPAPADTQVGQGVLDGDGVVMVFIERQELKARGGLADLVTFDLVRGVELTRHTIANFGDRIIAFDGDRVIIDRQPDDPVLSPVMVAVHLGEGAMYTSEGTFSIGNLGDQ